MEKLACFITAGGHKKRWFAGEGFASCQLLQKMYRSVTFQPPRLPPMGWLFPATGAAFSSEKYRF
ncbi:hypothetical protein KZX77_23480 (plasmid) [Escherichia coli]|uniref:hypothetical protein n=1 Tax=Escherichia coli TaxID=562 RepID=UPI001C73EE24|nr:hypothetical protein [Escherichia coli]QYE13637.1 hypothetical protein KZX77_23480 [Escherichia coli]